MELFADILLVIGAIGAGLYCFILGKRLRKFNDLEVGIGGAVAVLSTQVEDLTRTLDTARKMSGSSEEALQDLALRAESVAQRLELAMASMHDLSLDEKPKAKEQDPPRDDGAPKADSLVFSSRLGRGA
ncbi:MAG: hypothetical protein ACU0BB_15695 [Paracoccaceae bacterium]